LFVNTYSVTNIPHRILRSSPQEILRHCLYQSINIGDCVKSVALLVKSPSTWSRHSCSADLTIATLYSQTTIRPLQRVQGAAARLVIITKQRHHITPVLMRLHWLPIKSRIVYKLFLLKHLIHTNQRPAYNGLDGWTHCSIRFFIYTFWPHSVRWYCYSSNLSDDALYIIKSTSSQYQSLNKKYIKYTDTMNQQG